jgi:hypothetical protein
MLAEEKVRRLDALGFCWERQATIAAAIEATWKQRFRELERFKKEHGHCIVPTEYEPNPALGRWVSWTRHQKKRGKLDKEKVRCLDALGFCWAPQDTWNQHIRDLKTFKKEHGHCDVPMRYPPNPVLGHWVNGVRQWKKRGALAEDRVRCLAALGFSWAMKQRGVQVPWEQRINDLKAFKKQHGHCNVPWEFPPDPALGIWVFNLRARKKRGELTEDKILSLDALGFCWERRERSKLPKKQR